MIKPIKFMAAATALVMIETPALSTNWIYTTSDIDNTDYYYDSDKIDRSGNLITVWERWDHSRNKKEKLRERKVLTAYDCSDRTYMNLYAIQYRSDGSHNSVNWPPHEREWKFAAPETVAEGVLKAVCGIASDH